MDALCGVYGPRECETMGVRVTAAEDVERHRQHVAALLRTSLPVYTLADWRGETTMGGSSWSENTVYAIEMLCTDDSVRPQAWVRVRTVSADRPGELGLSPAAHRLAARLHLRTRPEAGTDPTPAVEAIHSRLMAATRNSVRVEVDGTRVPATAVRDPGSDMWFAHASREDHDIVLGGEHTEPGGLRLITVPSVEPYLPPPLRPWAPGSAAD